MWILVLPRSRYSNRFGPTVLMDWKAWALWLVISMSSLTSWSTKANGQEPEIKPPQSHPVYGQAHPDLEIYYQRLGIPNPQTTVKGDMGTTDMIGAFADLGGTLGALGFASWLVVFLLRQHDTERQEMRKSWSSERQRVQEEREKERSEFAAERQLHLSKDSDNDAAMRDSLQASQKQLIEIVHSNQEQVNSLKEIMTSHSQDLKSILLEMKMAITQNFERVHEHWDGATERRGPERRSTTKRRNAES